MSAGLQVVGTLLLYVGVDRAGGFAESLAGVPQGLLRLASQPMFDIGFVVHGQRHEPPQLLRVLR